ncbi:MAG TPA: HD domain-containing phosphohydrolase [Gemmatimonadaceae bacterium]|nr:HD domain-containing phosphohydrolase [Gemmatimonadaceae bacterium]
MSARERERAGCIPEAIAQYELAIAQAEQDGDNTVLAEALRRLAIVRQLREEREAARALCKRSHEVASTLGNQVLAAEALNTLGAMFIREGLLAEARETLLKALESSGARGDLAARAEQNLGVVANIQGKLDEAVERYGRALRQYQEIGDEHGCAGALHNLGMLSVDCNRFEDADRYLLESLAIAERAGDVRLRGHCLLNHADVHVAFRRYEDARREAEAAIAIFDQLGARVPKADAYRVIGVVYRETGRLALAESRLRAAIDYATGANSVLSEAEATRELAIVYQTTGRNQEALALLNKAHTLFGKLDARIDLINVGGHVVALEDTYFAVVREWGQSIESSDSYTHGHCERVADLSVAVAKQLGMDEHEQTTIRLGAYLHDLGKVKVPHEILNKNGPLTREEFEVIQMHPVWGIEMLDDIEFPWDIKPIIRWHHEKYSGHGYPDRLRGDEIPVMAQIVGIVDVYDALTTTRSYRPAMTLDKALEEITKSRASWSPAVFDTFMQVIAAGLDPVFATPFSVGRAA